jgi:hypothetical protein
VLVLKGQYGPAQGCGAQQERNVRQQAGTHTMQEDDGVQAALGCSLPASAQVQKVLRGSSPAPTPCRKMMGCNWPWDARCLQVVQQVQQVQKVQQIDHHDTGPCCQRQKVVR